MRVGLFSDLNFGEMRAAFKFVESEGVSFIHENSFGFAFIPNILHQPEVL